MREAALQALAESGAPPAEGGTAWRAVLAYVIGSIELDAETEAGAGAFEEGLERVLRGTIGA